MKSLNQNTHNEIVRIACGYILSLPDDQLRDVVKELPWLTREHFEWVYKHPQYRSGKELEVVRKVVQMLQQEGSRTRGD